MFIHRFFLLPMAITSFLIVSESMVQGSEKENVDIKVSQSSKISFEDYLRLMEERIYQWSFALPKGEYKIDLYAENYKSESSEPEKIILQPNVNYVIKVADKEPVTLTLRLPSQKNPECNLLLEYSSNGASHYSNLSCCPDFNKVWLPTKENKSSFVVCFNKSKISLDSSTNLLYVSFGNNKFSYDEKNNIQPPVKLAEQGRLILFCIKITMLDKNMEY